MNISKRATKVCIIEDNNAYGESLKVELQESNIFDEITLDFKGRSGLSSVKSCSPQLVILDFQLSDITGLEVARRIKAYNDQIKIFMLTAHNEVPIIQRIMNDPNIDSISVKGSPYFELNFLVTVKYILAGGKYVEPTVLYKLNESHEYIGLNSLSPREFEIFIHINSGKSDLQIAGDLCVQIEHVKNIKSKIIKKIKRDKIDRLTESLIDNA